MHEGSSPIASADGDPQAREAPGGQRDTGDEPALDAPARAKLRLAKRTHYPAVLRELAGDAHHRVRSAVAANTATPSATLRQLSKDTNPTVVAAVAVNPSAPARLLEALARSKHTRIAVAVARNPGAPAELLATFLDRYEPRTKNAALDNPALPFEVKLAFTSSKGGHYYRYHVVADPRVPSETVARWVAEANQCAIEDQRLLDLVLRTRELDATIHEALIFEQSCTTWGTKALEHPRVTGDMLLTLLELHPQLGEMHQTVLNHPRADGRHVRFVLDAIADDDGFTMHFEDHELAAFARELACCGEADAERAPALVIECPTPVSLDVDERVVRQLRRLGRQCLEPTSHLRVAPESEDSTGWSAALAPVIGGGWVEEVGDDAPPRRACFAVEAAPGGSGRFDPAAPITLSMDEGAAQALSGARIRWSVTRQRFEYGDVEDFVARAAVPDHVVLIP